LCTSHVINAAPMHGYQRAVILTIFSFIESTTKANLEAKLFCLMHATTAALSHRCEEHISRVHSNSLQKNIGFKILDPLQMP
jgi:hypothetical protein